MKIDFTINKLKSQQQKVNEGDFEVWLNTTYSLIEEGFASHSSRAMNFRRLVSDFRTQKILGSIAEHVEKFKKQALEYIEDNIEHLEALRQKSDENAARSTPKTTFVSDKIKIENPHETPIPKTKLPFGVSAQFFWSIAVAIVSAAFILGYNFGTSRFDKEKSDFYDELKALKIDTSNFKKTIWLKDSLLENKDSILLSKVDSIIQLNNDLNNLYLLLGSYKEK